MRNIIFVAIVIVGLSVLYPLQRRIDAAKPAETADETLFFASGENIKRMSMGLDGLAADIYWIRTVQYFGRKVVDSGKPLSSATTKDLRMDLLAPLLNIVVTLDPHHVPAYHFGALFLPERDLPAAIALLEKGIRDNPNEWRLYLDLAYIYWQAGNASTAEAQEDNYAQSAYWFEKGGDVPGARSWMHDLAGLMKIKGGSREAARAMYEAYLSSDDEYVRTQAIERLKQLRALDEMDAINALLARYKEQTGGCPDDLRVLAPRLRAMNLTINDDSMPVDPNGLAYYYHQPTCKAYLHFESTVPR